MTEERLKLHEEAEKRINAIIDTLSQDKGGLAEKLKQEDVMDFLVSLWVDCSAEKNKLIEELQDKLGTVQMQKAGEKSDLVSHLVEANENYKKQIEELKKDKEVQTHNLNVLNDEIIRLQAQVEKMKCCSNCKFFCKCSLFSTQIHKENGVEYQTQAKWNKEKEKYCNVGYSGKYECWEIKENVYNLR